MRWTLDKDARGCPPSSHSRTREMFCGILRADGDHNQLVKDWITIYLRRNYRENSVIGRMIEAYRSDAAESEDIKMFFDIFDQTCKEHNIRHSDIWDMDET